MKSTYIFLLLLLPLLCNCSGADDYATPEPQPLEKIRFEVGMTLDNTFTRVATDVDFVSTWQAGDAVGVYVVNGTGGLQASGNYADNVKLTLDADGNWTTNVDIYKYANDELHFYAYYPYRADMTDATNTLFGSADQRSGAEFVASHLLIATPVSTTENNEPVQLAFSHAMAMVQVEVVRGAGIPPFSNDVIVALEPLKSTTYLNLSNGTQTPKANDSYIYMYQVPGTSLYRALVPAQTLSEKCMIELYDSAGTMYYTSTAPAGAELTAGKVHKYKIRIPGVKEAYAVGDVFPTTENPLGIVFSVTDEGKHGLIVGLNERYTAWGVEDTVTGAKNHSNGRINMNTIYDGYTISSYPTFDWVHSLNGGGATNYYTDSDATGVWYLPATEELEQLYTAYRDNTEAFRANLEAAGGTSLGNSIYWSSTETTNEKSCIFNVAVGEFSDKPKTDSYYVRAIMAF